MRRPAAFIVCLFFVWSLLQTQSQTSINIRGKIQQLYCYGSDGNPPIVLSSGDLGWAGLVEHIAQFLASQGYFVVGVNSKAYLSNFTTKKSALKPEDVPGDYRVIIELASRSSSTKPVLAGVSEGAGLSVLAATAPEVKERIRGILALGLPDQNELGWKWEDFTIWITKRTPNEPSFMVEDIIQRVSPVPLAEIHSTHDEFLPLEQAKAMLARAGEPKKMWVIEAANHRFSNNRQELDQRVLEALKWIEARRSD
jgi:pimeloyl-ACP methyl ester carboxylesterase